jgi:hypothetical protein
VRDFWLARTALERTLAARLPTGVAAVTPATDVAPAADPHQHHQHGGH